MGKLEGSQSGAASESVLREGGGRGGAGVAAGASRAPGGLDPRALVRAGRWTDSEARPKPHSNG